MEQALGGPIHSEVTKARLSSVANSIRLLTSFSGEEDELGITTLANRLRLAKSSVHRLATTLASAGFLEQNAETGKYRLGVALFALARSCVGAWTWRTRRVRSCASCSRRPARRSSLASSTDFSVLYAPVQRMSKRMLHTCVPTVIDTASAVSARLGYHRRPNGE